MYKTPFSFTILIAFILNTLGPLPYAQADDFHLPAPGVMIHISPEYDPPILRGIKVNPDNPFRFEFILDQGDSPTKNVVGLTDTHNRSSSPNASVGDLKEESTKLIKYFLASLTIPEKDLWVNLSPYEKNRVIPQTFGLTEMGRDLLAEDYILKQITASLIYPEGEIGKKFWKKVYEQAAKKFGTTNIPVNTFNKVWIVPDKAVIYENAKAGTAYVVESRLKVMLEQDYLSLQKHQKSVHNDTASIGANIIREIVIPELTREVNENKNFAKLRQVYNSLILATWYKKKIKESILEQVYANKNKVAGVGYGPNQINSIYQRYLRAFKKGVYNYIKDDIDPITQEAIPRKYFSGGCELSNLALEPGVMQYTDQMPRKPEYAMKVTTDFAMSPKNGVSQEDKAKVDLKDISEANNGAMKTGNGAQLSHNQAMINFVHKDRVDLPEYHPIDKRNGANYPVDPRGFSHLMFSIFKERTNFLLSQRLADNLIKDEGQYINSIPEVMRQGYEYEPDDNKIKEVGMKSDFQFDDLVVKRDDKGKVREKSLGEDVGWKFHLNVKPENALKVAKFLMQHGYHHKFLNGGDIGKGKAFTVYIGSFQLAKKLAWEISNGLGQLLAKPINQEEIEFAPGVVGRFTGFMGYRFRSIVQIAKQTDILDNFTFSPYSLYGDWGINYLTESLKEFGVRRAAELKNKPEQNVQAWEQSFEKLTQWYGDYFMDGSFVYDEVNRRVNDVEVSQPAIIYDKDAANLVPWYKKLRVLGNLLMTTNTEDINLRRAMAEILIANLQKDAGIMNPGYKNVFDRNKKRALSLWPDLKIGDSAQKVSSELRVDHVNNGAIQRRFDSIIRGIVGHEDLLSWDDQRWSIFNQEFVSAAERVKPGSINDDFKVMLGSLLTSKQVSAYKSPSGNFNVDDLIVILQRIHTIASDALGYGFHSELFAQHKASLDHFMNVTRLSDVDFLDVLEAMRMHPASVAKIVPSTRMQRLLKSGQFVLASQLMMASTGNQFLANYQAFVSTYHFNFIQAYETIFFDRIKQEVGSEWKNRFDEDQKTRIANSVIEVMKGDFYVLMHVMNALAAQGYQVNTLLGRGADGLAVKATGPFSGFRVLKINMIDNKTKKQDDFIERVESVSDMQGIVPHDGFLTMDFGGVTVIVEVNDFVQGQSLKSWISRNFTNATSQQLMHWISEYVDINRGLDKRGQVNRDMKNTANVIINPEGHLVLIDKGNIFPYSHEETLAYKKEMIAFVVRTLTGVYLTNMDGAWDLIRSILLKKNSPAEVMDIVSFLESGYADDTLSFPDFLDELKFRVDYAMKEGPHQKIGDRAQLSRFSYLVPLALVVFSAVGCSSPNYSNPEDFLNGPNNKQIGNVEDRAKARLIYINDFDDKNPTVLLIHGAADDHPLETFSGIISALKGKDNLILYAYDFQAPIDDVARALEGDIHNIKIEHHLESLTVMPFSYGNVVLRYAALLDPSLLKDSSLRQLAPTAGGSRLAEGMNFALSPFFVNIFSHANLNISQTQNPYGPIQGFIYSEENTKIINGIFKSIITFRASDDKNSLENNQDPEVRRHYLNGLGTHVIIIPGTTHSSLPEDPELIKRLEPVLENQVGDKAQLTKGGIDFNPDKMNLQVKTGSPTNTLGDESGGIKFHINPAMLEQLQNAPGFVPVIINIQPLGSLSEFLGMPQKSGNS